MKQHVLTLNDKTSVLIDTDGMRFDIRYEGNTVISANSKNLFYFEHLRTKDDATNTIPGINMEKAWEESFGGENDVRPNGPQSVGLDLSFVGFDHVYGLPEHATDLALKDTTGPNAAYTDPYRLYNFDIFEYELDNPMALYGHVPFMMAHSTNQTVGVFWLNAAETWVDVEKSASSGVVDGILKSFFGNKDEVKTVNSHWMSESGIIDVFFFVGPTPKDVFRQFTSLVGRQELPPLFSVAYHQCRWNYQDEADVKSVNGNFESYDIPYDVLWLDIEHTDGKRYFTWDSKTFPNPEKMINDMSSFGRKMVTIIDPHIKRDNDYYVHKEATRLGHYVKDNNGVNDLEGHCWPGGSSWVDFTSPEAREWWAEMFQFENYKGSTPDLYTWNDMNEPSVFNGPEVTMKKTAIHHGGWEHRDVHNLYGMMMHRATAEALVKRNEGHNKRPFVLSRAFYAGSQRWGAIWTGDNTASWEHMVASVPMLLSMNLGGISFSGADVGGFFGNPDPELLLRWYQVGAFQPFFRGHAHIDTKRREPWVFGEPWTTHIRDAIRTRYSYLPYLYTVFHEGSVNGAPVMRPMWIEFPEDNNTFNLQSSFLLGANLLVTPVTHSGQTSTSTYLPGTAAFWYDLANGNTQYHSGSTVSVSTPLDKISVFQRGGSIVPRKLRVRRSTAQMKNDPITLVVALSPASQATGELYLDDGDSFNYRNSKEFIHVAFEYEAQGNKATLKSTVLHSTDKHITDSTVERVTVLGASGPAKVTTTCEGKEVVLTSTFADGQLVVKKPNCLVSGAFTINFEF
eukprot:TRINITY_DN10485_c0_g1_i1.p1 TRINITY_DN10485_c0_g1~~TRINITY_DN10485_c0_g1_i1.p1  ORF type:complete len:926 (+),score=200.54 TRINITY_DN10485_c0_g1_i1:399-2780(+)